VEFNGFFVRRRGLRPDGILLLGRRCRLVVMGLKLREGQIKARYPRAD
jgi:hypothetical protein